MKLVSPHRAAAPLLLIATAALLSACGGSPNYPSLARRSAERVEGTGVPAAGTASAVPVLPPASADLTTRIAGLLDTARKAHATFQARQGAAERAAGAAGSAASDSWSAAQVALSDLQAARSGAVTALAELDRLYVDARAANPEQVSPSASAIATARDEVEGWVESQNAVIARLGGRLRS